MVERISRCFQHTQEKSESPCLAYFDSSKEVVIQVDSSKHGIGAVLLQEGCPIEYASRALTPSERNWVQIERVGAGRVSLTSFVLLWSFTLWKLRSFWNKSSCCSNNPAFSLVCKLPVL